MACAQIKGIVMIQLDLAYAMKDLRGTSVKVKKPNQIYNVIYVCSLNGSDKFTRFR